MATYVLPAAQGQRTHSTQPYGEESISLVLMFYLVIGVSGFSLFIILLSMVFVTLAQDDQIVIIDTDDEDIHESELQDDNEYNEITVKLLKQKFKSPDKLLIKTPQVMKNIIYFLNKITTFRFKIHHLYKQYRQDIGRQYI